MPDYIAVEERLDFLGRRRLRQLDAVLRVGLVEPVEEIVGLHDAVDANVHAVLAWQEDDFVVPSPAERTGVPVFVDAAPH